MFIHRQQAKNKVKKLFISDNYKTSKLGWRSSNSHRLSE